MALAVPPVVTRHLPARLLVQIAESDTLHELGCFEVPVNVVAVPADPGIDRTRLVIDVKGSVDPDQLRASIAQACRDAADTLG